METTSNLFNTHRQAWPTVLPSRKITLKQYPSAMAGVYKYGQKIAAKRMQGIKTVTVIIKIMIVIIIILNKGYKR